MGDGENVVDRVLTLLDNVQKNAADDRARWQEDLRRLEDKTDKRLEASEARQVAALSDMKQTIEASEARSISAIDELKYTFQKRDEKAEADQAKRDRDLLDSVAMRIRAAVDEAKQPTTMQFLMQIAKWALLLAMAAVLVMAGKAELVGKVMGQ